MTVPSCTEERMQREKILPPYTSCVGFGFFLPSSSPPLVREKQQVEVHPSALLSPSNPMAWLSFALGSLGNPVEVIPDRSQPQLLSTILETCLRPPTLPLKAPGRDIPDGLAFPWSAPFIATAAAPGERNINKGARVPLTVSSPDSLWSPFC